MKKTILICIVTIFLVLIVSCEKNDGYMAGTEAISRGEDLLSEESELVEPPSNYESSNASDGDLVFFEESKYDEVWSTDSKTEEQIFEGGGMVLYLAYDGDCVSGQLYNIQGITQRVADISFSKEQMIDEKISFEFDDGFGSGDMDIQFEGDSILVKVKKYIYAQDNNSGWGTDSEYVLLKSE
ncbi:hypothetical protein SAMN02745247_02449 [Butyrivibrio hungatei DSM 14810]|uniref:Uncharacterized protein n=1 Tax=Butyrivibrio hungatei DSM 14810 TaxID=1121132 RepID=A0A1M7STZ0_9FIRM|nr:hypothetical protein [Butyrivibrio hungatei]SHN62013.1 hypothetical protein SAMN02745247_02449 [Butyrivibrio hungatei DSM 14810]